MNEIIEKFSSIIIDFIIVKEGITGEKEIQRCEITFINHSRLMVYESVQRTKFKYSYHWLNPNNITIFRWDNAPHFPNLKTFPFHRHVGENENAEAFDKISLEDVLLFISKHIV
jgi:hypothetical protein